MDPNKKLIGMLEQIKELIRLQLSNEFIMKSILDFVKNALEKKIIDMTKNKQESNGIQPVQVLFMFILFTIINKII